MNLSYAPDSRVFVGKPIEDIKASNKLLQERYDTAIKAYDDLDVSINNLNLLDKDYAIKKARLEAIKKGIQNTVDNGDWEHAGKVVTNLYKDYLKDKGIKQAMNNYATRQVFASKLAENTELDDKDKSKLLGISDDLYSGVTIDPKTGEALGSYKGIAPNKMYNAHDLLNEFLKGWKFDQDSKAWVNPDVNSPFIQSGKYNHKYVNYQELLTAGQNYLDNHQGYQNWRETRKLIDTYGVNPTALDLSNLLVSKTDPTGVNTYTKIYDSQKSKHPDMTENELNKRIYGNILDDRDLMTAAKTVSSKYSYDQYEKWADAKNNDIYSIGYKHKLENPIIPIEVKEAGITIDAPTGKTLDAHNLYRTTLATNKQLLINQLKTETGIDFTNTSNMSTLRVMAGMKGNYAAGDGKKLGNGKVFSQEYWKSVLSRVNSINNDIKVADEVKQNAYDAAYKTLSPEEKVIYNSQGGMNDKVYMENIAKRNALIKQKDAISTISDIGGKKKAFLESEINKLNIKFSNYERVYNKVVDKASDYFKDNSEITLDNTSTNNFTINGDQEGGAKLLNSIGNFVGKNGAGLTGIHVYVENTGTEKSKGLQKYNDVIKDIYNPQIDPKSYTLTVMPTASGEYRLGYVTTVFGDVSEKNKTQVTRRIVIPVEKMDNSAVRELEKSPSIKVQKEFVKAKVMYRNKGTHYLNPDEFGNTVRVNFDSPTTPFEILINGTWVGHTQSEGINKLANPQ